jgi:hypothetical protein
VIRAGIAKSLRAVIGVATNPGLMTVTSMCCCTSQRRLSKKYASAAFDAP